MKNIFCICIAAALTATIFVVPAGAGTVLELKTQDVDTGAGDATVYLDANKLRIDSNETGKDYSIIYMAGGGNKTTYWIIDRTDKAYYEITPEDMKKMQEQIEQTLRMVHDRMNAMPPSQRKKVERSYEEQMIMMGRGTDLYRYDEVSSGVAIGDWSTVHYSGVVGERKLEDVWVATVEDLGAPKSDFDIVLHMAEMFVSVGQRMPAFFQFGRINGTDAFPVKVVSYKDGQETERTEVTSVKQQDLAATVFALPDGLTKKVLEPANSR